MSSIGFVRSELAALSRGELSPDQVMDSINAHIEKRLQDERAEIAQAIDEKATEMQDGRLLGRDRGAEARSYLAAGMRMAAQTVRGEVS